MFRTTLRDVPRASQTDSADRSEVDDGGRPARPLAESLVEVAESLLRGEGPHAVSLRRVADAAGTTTQAVYTSFGGKPGLIDALYREGYRRLADRLAEVDLPADPIERISALGAAYRERALADPHLYELMTGHPIAGYEPPQASRREARATLQPLVDAASDAVDAGLLEGEPTRIAHLLWAAGHGLVGLEIHGLAPDDPDAAYARMTDALLAGHRPSAES